MVERKIPEHLKCPNCDGKGKVWGFNKKGKYAYVKCPDCQGTGIKKGTALDLVNNTSVLNDDDKDALNGLVPNAEYLKDFSRRDALRDRVYRRIPADVRDNSFEILVDFMEDTLASLSNGILPSKSYFIYSPFVKVNKLFIYNAIKASFLSGLHPTKLLDVMWVYGKLDQAKYDDIDRQLEGKNIVFMNITNVYSTKNHNELGLQYVADYCDSNGIPLVVTSVKSVLQLMAKSGSTFVQPEFIADHVNNNDFGMLEAKVISNDLARAWWNLRYIQQDAYGNFGKDSEGNKLTPLEIREQKSKDMGD